MDTSDVLTIVLSKVDRKALRHSLQAIQHILKPQDLGSPNPTFNNCNRHAFKHGSDRDSSSTWSTLTFSGGMGCLDKVLLMAALAGRGSSSEMVVVEFNSREVKFVGPIDNNLSTG